MSIHPSLDYPKQAEHTEIVRKYVAGLINYYKITPFVYEREKEGGIEFGVTDPKELKKRRQRRRRKKKKPKVELSPKLREVLYNGRVYTEDDLSQLASSANLARIAASKLAGEAVTYCCSALRVESKIDYKCECKDKKHYKIVNGKT